MLPEPVEAAIGLAEEPFDIVVEVISKLTEGLIDNVKTEVGSLLLLIMILVEMQL